MIKMPPTPTKAEPAEIFTPRRRILELPKLRQAVTANPIMATPAITAPAYIVLSVACSIQFILSARTKFEPIDEYEIAQVNSEELLEINSLIRAGLKNGRNAAKHTQIMNALSIIISVDERCAVFVILKSSLSLGDKGYFSGANRTVGVPI